MIEVGLPGELKLLIPYIINVEISVIFPIMAGLAELQFLKESISELTVNART